MAINQVRDALRNASPASVLRAPLRKGRLMQQNKWLQAEVRPAQSHSSARKAAADGKVPPDDFCAQVHHQRRCQRTSRDGGIAQERSSRILRSGARTDRRRSAARRIRRECRRRQTVHSGAIQRAHAADRHRSFAGVFSPEKSAPCARSAGSGFTCNLHPQDLRSIFWNWRAVANFLNDFAYPRHCSLSRRRCSQRCAGNTQRRGRSKGNKLPYRLLLLLCLHRATPGSTSCC